jgi:hypothetical protein
MMRKCHGWRAAEGLRSCFTFSVGKMFLIEKPCIQWVFIEEKMLKNSEESRTNTCV